MRRGVAVLAAGASRRLGQPKQLLMLNGETLIQRAVNLAAASSCEAVAVVLGCEAQRVAAVLAGSSAECLLNDAWAEGMAASIRVAALWAEQRELDALMLMVCDQVRLQRAHLLQLWAAWQQQPLHAVGSCYADTIGIPAIFPRPRYPALLELQGDRGAAKLLRASAVTQVPWPEGVYDLDTLDDLNRA